MTTSIENTKKPVLALVPGDPTGIGPEQTARILANGRMREHAHFILVGDRRVLEMGMQQAGVTVPITTITHPSQADFTAQSIPIIDLDNLDPNEFEIGKPDPTVGKRVGETLSAAVDIAKENWVQGVAFAPLHKKAMFDGGWRFPDEHQLFANLLGHNGMFREMNVLDGQWMSRVTSHTSLRNALDMITEENICKSLRLTDATMRKAGIENPRIAVAALNPHGGEGGLFGTEEIDIIAPAVQKMAAEGINCEGPFPSDTVYLKAFSGQYDSVLAMYHDQGQIATKLKGFNKGVTITAGLDVVFTTPAHGTAHDIVGRGIADTGAFESAIALAAKLANLGQSKEQETA
ncbi:4-hydroxythreonine-4-phosphate dehydrogenase [Falsochrobactrum shanghaiense]|uniref:4-hydroxythreonine-4-phosphate dehydrogenase n=1 Tax=Falsochrobactrum shanghaiense TaxID=2201899 RepID=A0A316J6W3_9HYPH|nr:4-hydroxythreonine-4-phosphate dehydrogenase PdxA [Falsochrobactrum shanghaiense]PWL16505.1 4-hydroxythreonine-4-phosphate dehydrogenase [Falsochrobactrum shanghaiense]